MTIMSDLKKCSPTTRRYLLNTSKKFLTKFPNMHTIIIKKVPYTFDSQERQDFSFFLFMGEDINCPRKIKRMACNEPNHRKKYEYRMEMVRVYNPEMGYEKMDFHPLREEALFLPGKMRRKYQDYLDNNLTCFRQVDNNYPLAPLFIIDSPLMKKDNPEYYQIYLTQQFDTGYLLYHEQLRPEVTLPE